MYCCSHLFLRYDDPMRAPSNKPRYKRPLILLTGFGSFPGVADNVTERLVPEVAQRARARFPGFDFETEILATVWQTAPRLAAELHNHHKPVLMLHFGVAKSARGFRIEAQARNACHQTPDAHGGMPASNTISQGGTELRPVTIPTRDIVSRLQQQGFPAELSDDAGGYLCNAVLYHSLSAAESAVSGGPPTGFIHIPSEFLDSGLSYEAAVTGALEIIGVCISALPLEKD